MMQKPNFGIAGTKYYIPEKKIYVDKIAKKMKVDARTVKNIGIEYISETKRYSASEMGLKTAKELLHELKIQPVDLDMLIYSTNVPEKIAWSGSAKIAYDLGLPAFPSLDIFQGCNSSIAALDIVSKYFQSEQSINNILYVTADKSPIRYLPGFSFYTHGAGSILFNREAKNVTPLSTVFFGNGKYADHLYIVGGLNSPKLGGEATSIHIRKKAAAKMQMDIFRELLDNSVLAINMALKKASCRLEDIDLFIPNNTTKAVPYFLKERLNIKEEKIFVENIPKGRHIGAADFVINIHDVVEMKKNNDEMKVCLISYAGGFYWGSSIISII